IAAYAMLLFMARLQRFDTTLEEAALDLGASHLQVFRRITLPYLMPAVLSAAFIAFLQSFENYNTTIFVRGLDTTLTVYIASKVRTGLTPAINALSLILIGLTVAGAVAYELLRRRDARRAARRKTG
ncbi:MAG TPA: ABC transporter permease subunit, partial [Arenibaculum sp.]|nr:ABC transporter permease subunit [Arenibaculum sp.]